MNKNVPEPNKVHDFLSICLEETVLHQYSDKCEYIRLMDYSGMSIDTSHSVVILFDMGFWPEGWKLEAEGKNFQKVLNDFISIIDKCFDSPLRVDRLFAGGLIYLHAYNPRSDDDFRFPNSSVPRYSDLIRFSEEVVARARTQLGIDAKAVIGCYMARSIPAAVSDLTETLKFRAFIRDAAAVYVEKDNRERLSNLYYTPDKEVFERTQWIYNAINEMDAGGIRENVDSLFDYLLRYELNTKSELEFVFMTALTNLMQLLKNGNIPLDALYALNIYKVMGEAESLEELCSGISSGLAALSHGLKARKNAGIGDKISEITEYVEINYSDAAMSVSAIADKYNISQSYLSAQFKLRMGIGLLEYIHKCRVSRAKRLINETDNTLAEISAMVGFGNIATMFRAFKKYEGTTPGATRK